MHKYILFITLFATFFFACKRQPVESVGKSILFSIDNRAVLAEEFIYLYEKNNFNNEDIYSREDIKNYFDLFVNFKLKVRQGYEEGIDTMNSFVNEFNSYKAELIKPYRLQTQETSALVKETYQRLQEFIHASHILVQVSDFDNPEDTLKAYQKITEIRGKALAGEDFAELARQFSEDPSARTNAGDLGLFTAMRMVVLPFENAAYNTEAGAISDIVKTQFGYHILKVHEKIPNKGKVNVAHIMVTANGENADAAQNKIFELHEKATAGGDWNYLVMQFSDDERTRETGGDIGVFGQGQLPPEFRDFEQVAFELDSIGQISEPVASPYGWHILKLLNKYPPESFEEIREELERNVIRGDRAEAKRDQIIQQLKKESHFLENKKVLEIIYLCADTTLWSGKWENNFPDTLQNSPIFQLKNESIKVKEFAAYIEKNQKRVRSSDPKKQMEQLYEKFVETKLTEFEEEQIAFKNTDYRMLENEYREGLILFEVMDRHVWKKSLKDTAGIATFFRENQDRYQWKQRAEALIVKVNDAQLVPEVRKYLEQEPKPEKKAVEEAFNQNSALAVQAEQGVFEKGDHELLEKTDWKEGVAEYQDGGRVVLIKISEVLPPKPKTLDEARGKVISDYQTKLEEDWLKELKSKYEVTVNEQTLNKIYQYFEKK